MDDLEDLEQLVVGRVGADKNDDEGEARTGDFKDVQKTCYHTAKFKDLAEGLQRHLVASCEEMAAREAKLEQQSKQIGKLKNKLKKGEAVVQHEHDQLEADKQDLAKRIKAVEDREAGALAREKDLANREHLQLSAMVKERQQNSDKAERLTLREVMVQEMECKADEALQARNALFLNYPALIELEKFLLEGVPRLRNGNEEDIPVLAIRWSQRDIYYKAVFMAGPHKEKSIYLLLDQLQRGKVEIDALDDQIVLIEKDGLLWVVHGHRRLSMACAFQGLRRDTLVKSRCQVYKYNEAQESLDGIKIKDLYDQRFDNPCDGLRIAYKDVPGAEAMNDGGPLFAPPFGTSKCKAQLQKYLVKHPHAKDDPDLMWRLQHRPSKQSPDEYSFTEGSVRLNESGPRSSRSRVRSSQMHESGPGSRQSRVQSCSPREAAGQAGEVDMPVPNDEWVVGRIVGKDGSHMRLLYEQSGVQQIKVQSDGEAWGSTRYIKIKGTAECVAQCQRMIKEVVDEWDEWHGVRAVKY